MSTNQDALYDITRLNVDISNENILNVRKLKFHKGAIYGVVGPAGSGKTTMLKLLSGLIKESSGEVKYDNSFFETNWISQYTGATYTKQWLGLTVDSSEETISTIYLWIRTA